MSGNLLPLFPLKVVLFPAAELPLHIFEERYKEMIGECLADQAEFGIVLVLDEGIASTGCTAAISEVIRKLADGRMDILVRGERRFEIVRLDQERSYLRGEPQFFEDEGDHEPPEPESRRQVLRLFEEIAAKIASEHGGEPLAVPDVDDPQLSFQIAARLPVELTFRQRLLQMRSENDRIARLNPYLEKLTLRLTRTRGARERAAGNGRAH